jgi:hypothetical protein
MWGNRNGWLIAIGMVVFLCAAFGYAVYAAGRTTAATELTDPARPGHSPETLAPIALPIDPLRVIELNISKGTDAGSIYWRAIDEVKENPRQYENFRPSLKDASKYAALAAIVEAAEHSHADIFQRQPDAVVRYGPKPALRALETLGNGCIYLGIQAATAKDYAGAKKWLTSTYVLGLRLFQDRQSRAQLDIGIGMMAGAAQILAQIANVEKETTRAERLSDFVTQYRDYDKNHIKKIERVITSIDPKVMRQYVGDVFNLAQSSDERVWRNEATLRLGLYKFNSPLPGDRLRANRTIRKLAVSDDPAVKAAALAARDLTVEEYRKLGSE